MSPRESLQVDDGGRVIVFTYDDMMRYHGPHSPAGVAIAFKAMQRAFAELCPDAPPPRRSVVVRTPFRAPGARDGFEAVVRAVSEGHYTVDRSLLRADRGRLLEDFAFEVSIGDRTARLLLRGGFVTPEFIDLARSQDRSAEQERRLAELKAALARAVMSTAAADVFEVAD